MSRPEFHPAAHVARKRFGQNFLIDRAVIVNILDTLRPAPGERIVEIGPGLGALTHPLLQRLDSLDVVEIDRDLIARLSATYPQHRLRIHAGDALKFDYCSLGQALRVVGNLPYNISSPLLFRLAESATCLRDCHFMLQEEVVDRMAAEPGGKEYGRLSVMLQYHFKIEKLFKVPADAFRPVPRVESAFVRLEPCAPALRATDEKLWARLVAQAFTKRRKTLRNALREQMQPADWIGLELDARLRPEDLPPEDYVRIANHLAASA